MRLGGYNTFTLWFMHLSPFWRRFYLCLVLVPSLLIVYPCWILGIGLRTAFSAMLDFWEETNVPEGFRKIWDGR